MKLFIRFQSSTERPLKFVGNFIVRFIYKRYNYLSILGLKLIHVTKQGHGIPPCYSRSVPWWRHQMETFSALLAICAGNSPVPGEFPAQRPVTRSFDVFFDLRPNKQLSKQWWGWWFEAPSWSLWRHRNAIPELRFRFRLRIDIT